MNLEAELRSISSQGDNIRLTTIDDNQMMVEESAEHEKSTVQTTLTAETTTEQTTTKTQKITNRTAMPEKEEVLEEESAHILADDEGLVDVDINKQEIVCKALEVQTCYKLLPYTATGLSFRFF